MTNHDDVLPIPEPKPVNVEVEHPEILPMEAPDKTLVSTEPNEPGIEVVHSVPALNPVLAPSDPATPEVEQKTPEPLLIAGTKPEPAHLPTIIEELKAWFAKLDETLGRDVAAAKGHLTNAIEYLEKHVKEVF